MKARQGFTVIELLVSMTILGIISLLLVAMLSQVGKSWNQVKGQIDVRQTGRSVLALMASEIQLAALPKDRINKTTGPQFVVDPTALGSAYSFPHCAFWQAPIATTSSNGNLAEVGYFVKWDKTNANNPRPILCRFFVNPNSSNYYINSSVTFQSPYTAGTAWLSPTIVDAVADGTSSGNYSGWVADNVLGLWFRCLDSSGRPITKAGTLQTQPSGGTSPSIDPSNLYAFDSRLAYTNASGVLKSGASDSQGGSGILYQVLTTLPYYVEIAVVVIDSQTAAKISTTNPNTTISTDPTSGLYKPASEDPSNMWGEINTFISSLPSGIQKSARVYSTRVHIISGDY